MPWKLVHNHPACRAGEWAVVNQQAEAEGRHSIEGCHGTREEALAQQRALYAKEPQMQRSSFTAPVEWKAAASDPGMLEGHASIFGNVDLGGDVVLPGAFRKTLADWAQSKRRIPLLVDHKMSTEGVIGSLDWAKEDQVGLAFAARFSSIQKAQDIRTLLREKHLDGLSFTYEPIRARPGMKGGEQVRYLEELRLFEATVTPFPMNLLAVPSLVKSLEDKVSDTPWSNFTQTDYTPEQWRRACLIDTGQGAVDSKDRYKLPVREPGGAVNRGGVHAAAGGHGVGAVQGVSAEVKQAAARALVGLYRSQLGEDPPPSLLRLAGMSAASLDFDTFSGAMTKALEIEFEPARKAAVDQLVTAYQTAAGPPEGPDATATAAATTLEGPAGTAQDAAHTGTSPSPLTPREYVDDVLQRVEQADGSPESLDALEAKIRASLGGA